MPHTTPFPVRRASQGRGGCAHTTARELSAVLHNNIHFCTTKAAGRPLAKPAADWSRVAVATYGAGMFLLGFAVVGGFQ